MMSLFRGLLLVIASFALTTQASAQLADGTYAPDFTITDLNGNTHNLYSTLDSGYTVYLQFNGASVIWSHVYHWNGAMQQLWNTHGPAGSDEVRIFFIEAEPGATLADLQGTGPNTYGNYTNGTPYPMAIDQAVGAAYGVTGYPRIYRVCPDRLLYNAPQYSYPGLVYSIGMCDTIPAATNDAAVLRVVETPVISCTNNSFSTPVAIVNEGSNALTSVDVVASLNGSDLATVNWSGNLAQFDTAHVSFSNLLLSTGTLAFRTENPNGNADSNPANDTLTQTVYDPFEVTSLQVQIDVVTDNWPADISWVIEDANGTTVLSSPPYTQTFTVYQNVYSLPAAGCYKIKVLDAFGNGIVGGYVNLRNEFGATNLYFDGADFGAADSAYFYANDESIRIVGNGWSPHCDSTNGYITVGTLPTSGTYTYQWEFPDGSTATGDSIYGLAPGIYTVTSTNATNTSVVSSVLVPESTLPIVVMSDVDPTCSNDNGSVTASPAFGTLPYTYQWNTGDTGPTLNNVPSGGYHVTVTDAHSCQVVGFRFATFVGGPYATIEHQNPSDCGLTDGSATVYTEDAAGATYQWDAAAGNQTTATATGLGGGTYSVTVTAAGCSIVRSVTIFADTVPISATITAENCGADGAVAALGGGGAGPFTYAWSDGQTTATATGLVGGTYTVTVTDSTGCATPKSYVVPAGTNVLTASTAATGTSCGANNGTIAASVTSGLAPYTYAWSNGQAGANQAGLSPGNYAVTVTASNGCFLTFSDTIAASDSVSVVTTATNAQCGQADGSIAATATAGLAPFSYLWSDGQTTATATALAAGTYTVTVSDSAGCTQVLQDVVSSPNPPQLTTQATTDSCATGSGSVTVTATAGNAPYTFLWSNGQTTATATALAGGSYTVTVTDSTGCTASMSAAVVTTPAVLATATATDATCANADGEATASSTTGTPPFTYLWSNGQTSSIATALLPGNYSVTITDSNGCFDATSATVMSGSSVNISTTANNASCGMADGTATATATGGATPYSYQWDATTGNQTTSTATGLTVGVYSVTTTDANGCTAADTVQVSDSGGITASVTTNDESCGQANGSAGATVSGGMAPFLYTWDAASGSQTTATATGLSAGQYSVTITDANGCSAVQTVQLGGTPALQVSGTATTADCGSSNGTASLTVTQGLSPFSYLWDASASNATTATVTGLAAGTYNVTVTDANACITQLAVSVGNTNAPTAAGSVTDVTCFGEDDGAIDLSLSGGAMPYSFAWNTGLTTEDLSGLSGGAYDVTVTDAAGCVTLESFVVTEPQQLVISGMVQNTSAGGSDGAIALTVTGGTPPYNYIWTNGNTTANPTGLTAGTYSVAVSDANSCSVSDIFEVEEAMSVTESWQSGVVLFPNPTTNAGATLQTALPSGGTVTIYNTLGEQVGSQRIGAGAQQTRIETRSFESGVYWLRISTTAASTTLPLLVD